MLASGVLLTRIDQHAQMAILGHRCLYGGPGIRFLSHITTEAAGCNPLRSQRRDSVIEEFLAPAHQHNLGAVLPEASGNAKSCGEKESKASEVMIINAPMPEPPPVMSATQSFKQSPRKGLFVIFPVW